MEKKNPYNLETERDIYKRNDVWDRRCGRNVGASIDITKFSHQLKLGDRVIYLRVCDATFSSFVCDGTFSN